MTEIQGDKEMNNRTIGSIIARHRKSKGLTQQQLARLIKLSRSYICDIENDRYTPSLKTMMLLSNILDINLNILSKMTEIQDKMIGI